MENLKKNPCTFVLAKWETYLPQTSGQLAVLIRVNEQTWFKVRETFVSE
jgi:hypothetical protein